MSAYRLDAPRPRQRPDPLQIDHSMSYKSASALNQQSPPLLYEVPSPFSTSPPGSPRSHLTSPTSPTHKRRSINRQARSGERTPPLGSGRNRSVTPVGDGDLNLFAEQCRAWYFDQDEHAGQQMSHTLATLPPSQRAAYARLQASVRATYHRTVSARKVAEFQAHLSATQPGGSLLPHCRADPSSADAKKERYQRFERFIRTWCTMGMPGPQPFFRALWALMTLQTMSTKAGGAGEYRIEWEIDDAVFMESGGRDFMIDAIDALKGILAFEEVAAPRKSTSTAGTATTHVRAQSQPLLSVQRPTKTPPVVPKRLRSPSDPFLDTHTPQALSRSVGSSTSGSSSQPDENALTPPLIPDKADGSTSPFSSAFGDAVGTDGREDEESLRIWTAPDLSSPDYLNLLQAFPAFVSRGASPRFPDKPPSGDLEEGYDATSREDTAIQFGTGSMWIGARTRSSGWEGGNWWTRFVSWCKNIFC
ncbi:hypothetical protein CYLTODRAFT_416276 [Cylindrobasidium torrendii FP15055 ss-10]|uniref:Uncharacterized protein n=1 Tax=Cylindrobasidium torrendii FP15055 ss-10 TaxID=1314674 RepID=A0A0D7BVI3_9AGAR|nr:hypothetical protein CYLTODRAFT_416276 [Cylindrobasidium torrendii FP15055 ss-10]